MVASREVEDALYTHPAVGEVAVIATPHERWVEAVTAVVVLRDGQTVTETELDRPRPRRRSRRSSCPRRSTSSTSCPATRAASCSSGCSATTWRSRPAPR